MENFIFALILTTIAGLSTTIGSVIALFFKEPGPKYISISMGFSAGVMILISFVELLQQGIESLGFFNGHLWFFIGMIIMFAVDLGISHKYEFEDSRKKEQNEKKEPKLEKTSLLIALGVFIQFSGRYGYI